MGDLLLVIVQMLVFLYVYCNATFKDEQRRYLRIGGNDVTKGKQEGTIKTIQYLVYWTELNWNLFPLHT